MLSRWVLEEKGSSRYEDFFFFKERNFVKKTFNLRTVVTVNHLFFYLLVHQVLVFCDFLFHFEGFKSTPVWENKPVPPSSLCTFKTPLISTGLLLELSQTKLVEPSLTLCYICLRSQMSELEMTSNLDWLCSKCKLENQLVLFTDHIGNTSW